MNGRSEFEVRSGLKGFLVALLKSYNIQLSIHKDNERDLKKGYLYINIR